MPVDEQTRRLLAAAAAGPFARFQDYEPAELRRFDAAANPLDAVARRLVEACEDRAIPGPGGDIPIRLYHPRDRRSRGLVVYFHGGGHAIGSIDVFDGFCCHLAAESGCLVISVEYRLAPEHKYPAGLQDCHAAYLWARAEAASLGADPERIALVGDSAGGAMVAGVTLVARGRGQPQPAFQALIYPMLAANAETPSRTRNGEGFLVTRAMVDYYMRHYVADEADWSDPLLAPALAEDLRGLPPALVITAEYDPLVDEGEEYARRLSEAGVDVICTRYGGTIHGFVKRYLAIEKGMLAIRQTGQTLRHALDRGWAQA